MSARSTTAALTCFSSSPPLRGDYNSLIGVSSIQSPKDEATTRVALIQVLIKDRPRVILKRVVPIGQRIHQLYSIVGDIRISDTDTHTL